MLLRTCISALHTLCVPSFKQNLKKVRKKRDILAALFVKIYVGLIDQ